jgi:hypothetical protein
MANRIQNNKYKHKLNCRPDTTCESSFPKDAVENSNILTLDNRIVGEGY